MTLLLLVGLVFAGIGGTRLLHIYLTSTGRQAADVPSKQDYPVRGVDLSYYQGNIDWDVLASQGVDFCFIKATEGVDHNDSQFAQNWQTAQAAKIYVGAYHFFRFEDTGREQAENFIRTVPVTENTLPPVIDVELYESLGGSMPDTGTARQNLQEMLDLLEAHYGVKPILYAAPNTYRAYVKSFAADYPIWISNYYYKPYFAWTFWQYTDSGDRLREEFGKESDADKIAESWELACHKDGSSILTSGSDAGLNLREYLDKNGTAFLGTNCADCTTVPVLIKLIDAKQDLSIQVHPDDDYAMRVEGEAGKTEMWYIVDAAPHAALYYGLKQEVTKAEFEQRIHDQTLTEILNRVEVKPGELYFIPSGTLHAIGAGILLAEIQQNSNTTYRVYDYGRRGADGKLRPLHIAKALDVTNLRPLAPTVQYPAEAVAGGTVRKLEACKYFASDVVTVHGTVAFTVGTESFHHLLFLSGEATLQTESGSYPVKKGSSVLLPAGLGAYTVTGESVQYVVTRVDEKLS